MARSAHLSDDRLIEICLEHAATAGEEAHRAACETCRERWLRLEGLLHEVSDAADAEVDAVFPAERLAVQHARILQRIEQDGRPARVIAFPASPLPQVRPLRTRPASRWIAGAAAAGLAVGLLAGQLAQRGSDAGAPARTTALRPAAATAAAAPEMRPANAVLNEEEFLFELEDAIAGPQLAVLRPLNDLTPQ